MIPKITTLLSAAIFFAASCYFTWPLVKEAKMGIKVNAIKLILVSMLWAVTSGWSIYATTMVAWEFRLGIFFWLLVILDLIGLAAAAVAAGNAIGVSWKSVGMKLAKFVAILIFIRFAGQDILNGFSTGKPSGVTLAVMFAIAAVVLIYGLLVPHHNSQGKIDDRNLITTGKTGTRILVAAFVLMVLQLAWKPTLWPMIHPYLWYTMSNAYNSVSQSLPRFMAEWLFGLVQSIR